MRAWNIGLFLMMAAGYISGCSTGNDEPSAKPASNSEKETESAWEKPKETAAAYKDWENNKGVGPVTHVALGETVDQLMADAGAKIYKEKCISCHKPDRRFIGPSPKGIFERRTPEWVMNMILKPEVMVKEDPIAKQLLIDFNLSPMANQNLTEEDARKVLRYFRTL